MPDAEAVKGRAYHGLPALSAPFSQHSRTFRTTMKRSSEDGGSHPTITKRTKTAASEGSADAGDGNDYTDCGEVETNGTVDTCLGMLESGLCLAVDTTKWRSNTVQAPIHFDGELAIVSSSATGDIVGILESRTAYALINLGKNFTMHYEVYLSHGLRDPSSKAKELWAQVVLYGQNKDSERIGVQLYKEHKLFLLDPEIYDETYPYKNPQKYEVTNVEIDEDLEQTELEKEAPKLRRNIPQADTGKLLNLFEQTDSNRDVGELDLSLQVRTKLKWHQQVATEFMRKQENKRIESSCLWKADKNGPMVGYRSTITGIHMVGLPAIVKGGLLADVMGLGKSLVALSLIASTKRSTLSTTIAGPTLIVSPLSMLLGWKTQITEHIKDGVFRVYTHHGPSREKGAEKIAANDIVLTTYSTIVSEFKGKDKPLYNISWHRIILDEAHFIKDSTTVRFKAVYNLPAVYRWCLTGTPLQNSLDDFEALVRFLRVAPFDAPGAFKRAISTPYNRGQQCALPRLQKLISEICLRRTKVSEGVELDIPPRVDHIVSVHLTDDERRFYDFTESQSTLFFQHGNSIVNALQSILRLRQICCHGSEMLPSKLRSSLLQIYRTSERHEIVSFDFSTFETNCEKCRTIIPEKALASNSLRLSCPHILCSLCSGSATKVRGSKRKIQANSDCPLCNPDQSEREDSVEGPGSSSDHSDRSTYHPSSKVEALLSKLSARSPGTKSVVFSEWTVLLDLTEMALKKAGFVDIARIDGSLNLDQRADNLGRFRNQPGCTILLASVACAGVGIDLTAASEVHLLEPLWNPTVEEQALDRIHRMGQRNKVHTFRYIVENTIEERVVDLQKKKLEMIGNSLGDTEEEDKRIVASLLKPKVPATCNDMPVTFDEDAMDIDT